MSSSDLNLPDLAQGGAVAQPRNNTPADTSEDMRERIAADLRRDLYAHLLSLSPAYHARMRSGETSTERELINEALQQQDHGQPHGDQAEQVTEGGTAAGREQHGHGCRCYASRRDMDATARPAADVSCGCSARTRR